MKYYAFVDANHPTQNLVLIVTKDSNLVLERVEVEVEPGESVVDKVKEVLELE